MIEAGSVLYSALFNSSTLTLRCAIESFNPGIVQTIIATLLQRRRQLQRLAEVELPSLALERLNLQHDRILDEQAFGVWKALSDYAVPVQEALRLGIWLTSKGADIRRNLPDFNGSVGHQIGGNLGFYLAYAQPYPNYHADPPTYEQVRKPTHKHLSTLDNQCWDFLLKILETTRADACLCGCSYYGCRSLTKILINFNKFIDSMFARKSDVLFAEKIKFWFLESFVEFFAPELEDSSALPSEIIRFATFTRLDLTHTCCDIGPYRVQQLEAAKIDEIREEKCITLSELEELVTVFETEYRELGVSLKVFLQGHWQKKWMSFFTSNQR